jgi:hypothetical protein
MKGKLLFISFLLFIGCTNDYITGPIKNELCEPTPKPCNYKPGPIYLPGEKLYGYVRGLKNCIPFEATTEAYLSVNGYIGVAFNTYEELSGRLADKEAVTLASKVHGNPISKWPLVIDTFPNLRYQSYYVMTDFDVLQDAYDIDNEYGYNFIEYCKLDSAEKKIYGNFEARFITSGFGIHGINPDTVLFSDCVFEAWHP